MLGLTMNSCKKDAIDTQTKDNTVVMDADAALKKFDGMYGESLKLISVLLNNGASFKTGGIAGCADVTVDTSSLPYHATFNFGSGCMDDEGHTRSGIVMLEFNQIDDMRTPGAYVNLTFNNFSLDNMKHNGTFAFNNNGLNTSNNLNFDYNFNLQMEDLNNGDNGTLTGSTQYEFIAGQGTETDDDDVLALTGQIQGTVSAGTTMTLTVLQPVIKNRGDVCNGNYIQGEVKIEQTGQSDKFIDYGSGTCDDQATQTVDGVSTQITLDGGFQ